MFHRLYVFLIEPRQKDEDLRNRELVLNVLLVGTLLLLGCGIVALAINYVILNHHYVLSQMTGISVAFVITCLVYRSSRSGRQRFAAWLLVGLYFVLAASVAWRWGVTIPSAVALFALVIMITGIVVGAPYPLYVAGTSILTIIGLEIARNKGVIQPDVSWMQDSTMTTAVGYCMVFGIIALVSWLFNQQIEQSLHRARRAETALTRQKDLLETTVEKRTRELQTAQLEKIQQMYRFAELGQLSTALLHDLANHVTTLSLDIEGLETKDRSQVLTRAKRSIRYIDDMVLRVRDQLQGKSNVRPFGVASEIDAILALLKHRAIRAHITLRLEVLPEHKRLKTRGEPARFRQLMTNIISNALDAYDGKPAESETRAVTITVAPKNNAVEIRVSDWGKGIPPAQRDKLFEPFYSTTDTGMGMGLSISRQIAEEHFRGKLYLDAKLTPTTFILTLPKG
jgi:signal transduction histidine kinase